MDRLWQKVWRRKSRGDLRHNDDLSETWSLPDWPELERDRVEHDLRVKRLERHRRKEEKKRVAEETGVIPIASSVSGSASTLYQADDDGEDDGVVGNATNPKRGRWTNQHEFLLALISMSVGMGNFYRFPFIAYQNGGGAFLIPYLIVVTLVGRPVYLMELAIGQFTSYGQVKMWDVLPLFRGVGYGTAFASFTVVSFFSAIMGQMIYYLFLSCSRKLPWTYCNPSWAGKTICDMIDNATAANKTITARNVVNLPQIFYEKKVIHLADNVDHGLGPVLPTQAFCLLLAWLIIFLMVSKGTQSTGKAAYVTTIYPFTVVIIMLIITCIQEGSMTGILYFLKPDWERMYEAQVWFAALGQCFFSLNCGFGSIINYASFNPFHHNIYKDALVVSCADTMVNLFGGIIVFAALGNIAHVQSKQIEDVAAHGPGLIFVVFTDAISNLHYVPQLVSILYFTMLLFLGAGVCVAWISSSATVICDKFPSLSRFWVTVVMCSINILFCLIYVTPGGQFMVTLVDYFGGNINIYILVVLEVVGIVWIYGLKNFVTDIEFMLNTKVHIFWKFCWGFFIPAVLTLVFVYNFVTAKRLTYKGIPFPDLAIAAGWVLALLSVVIVPLDALCTLDSMQGSWKERFLEAIKPKTSYGPKSARDRRRWLAYKQGYLLNGGPGPDTFRLLPGETPYQNNLPDWLMAHPDGTVVPVKDARAILEPEPGALAEASEMTAMGTEIPITEAYRHKPTPHPTNGHLNE